MPNSIVILRTNKPFVQEHQEVLIHLYQKGISLFCAVGEFARQWEDAMDDLVIEQSEHGANRHITTTSHANEEFEDVLNMAKHWNCKNGTPNVQIVKL